MFILPETKSNKTKQKPDKKVDKDSNKLAGMFAPP
jgi:hypothetical protein